MEHQAMQSVSVSAVDVSTILPTALLLYIDYHGVLDTGRPDKLEGMCRFLVAVDELPVNVFVCLLSYAPCSERGTLKDLNLAGIMDQFDQITFTRDPDGKPNKDDGGRIVHSHPS